MTNDKRLAQVSFITLMCSVSSGSAMQVIG